MNLKELAEKYHVLENVDHSDFQSQARILQSMWRDSQGYPIGHLGNRTLGSLLQMPWAKETLSNYLTEVIRGVVRQEVIEPGNSQGKLYGKPRIFNNLLSSQPLAFNLFAELQQDLPLATSVFQKMTDGRLAEVTGIDFEYSPGRGDERYTGDNSAFDVYVTYLTPTKQTGFIGIEVKYHESLQEKPSKHHARYDKVAAEMGCFRQDSLPSLKLKPFQQIWRDHLLAGSILNNKDFDDGFFVFLYPEGNHYCGNAGQKYKEFLRDDSSLRSWTIEDFCSSVRSHSQKEWINAFADRYLNFEKIDEALLENS